jgi:hypothetical protein
MTVFTMADAGELWFRQNWKPVEGVQKRWRGEQVAAV